jgi:N-carbamoylputrescine amidase
MEALSPVPESKLRIACLQMEPQVAKKARNVEQSLVMLADAARRGVALAVLPELCNSGSVFRHARGSLRPCRGVPNGPTCRASAELAARHGIEIVAGPRVVRERQPRGRKGAVSTGRT